jgi:hypothetical protein
MAGIMFFIVVILQVVIRVEMLIARLAIVVPRAPSVMLPQTRPRSKIPAAVSADVVSGRVFLMLPQRSFVRKISLAAVAVHHGLN